MTTAKRKKSNKKNSNKRGQGLTKSKRAWRPSTKQIEAVRLMVDLDQHLSITEVCQKVDISRQCLYNWLADDNFSKYFNELLDLETDAGVVDAFRSLKRQMKRGNATAAIKYLEVKQRFTPKVKHELSGDPDNPITHQVYVPVFNMPVPQVKQVEAPTGSDNITILDQAKAVAAGGVDDEDL